MPLKLVNFNKSTLKLITLKKKTKPWISKNCLKTKILRLWTLQRQTLQTIVLV